MAVELRRKYAAMIDCATIWGTIGAITALIKGKPYQIIQEKTSGYGIQFNIVESLKFLLFVIVAYSAIVMLFTLKDLVFRNASIGKRVMGLIIVDSNFNIPSIKVIIKRGFSISHKLEQYELHNWTKEGILSKWELDNLGTRVVDKKRFESDKEEYIKELIKPKR